MLTWPHADSDWGPYLDLIYPVFTAIGAAIAGDQRLLSVCASADQQADVRRMLLANGAPSDRLHFAQIPSNDAWARDHGPLVVLDDDAPAIVDFRFNGWGGKHASAVDDRITGRLHALGLFGPVPLTRPALVIEGGAIETDGHGTLLATRASIVDPARNPDVSPAEIEQHLRTLLGIERFLWLDHGALSGDDTDGHIDTLARFADPRTLLYQTVSVDHPDRTALTAMEAELAGLRRADGSSYRLVALPCPGQHRDKAGRLLPASYANFLITNCSILLPTYGVANDRAAVDVLAAAFPSRRIVPLDCRTIIQQHGSLHCVTMQLPRALTLHPISGERLQ
jgi:agmatine/peptidylarginine deiminase